MRSGERPRIATKFLGALCFVCSSSMVQALCTDVFPNGFNMFFPCLPAFCRYDSGYHHGSN